MGGIFVLFVYLAYYLWFVFLPLGGLFFFLGRWWRLKTSSWWGKLAGTFFLILGLALLSLGLLGAYFKLTEY